MKRISLRKLGRNKRKKETQSDEENSGEQPGSSRVVTVEKRTHQTDEGETDTAEILDLSNVSARTPHIDNNNRQMHSWLPSSQQELIASHQGYVPIYDPIRAQMNTSNNGRNTPVYTQQTYPHPSMLQGALGASYPHYNAIAYNQQMLSQPTTSHHAGAQLSEQHFNPTGVFAVENRAYQAGRAQAGNSDVTAYNQQAMMQPTTSHHPWTQFRPGSTDQLQHSTNDLRYTPMHVGRYVNDDSSIHQQTPAQPSTSQLGQTASNQNSVTRRIELKITGERMQCENFIVANDNLHFDNRQTSSQVPYVSQIDPASHTEATARNQCRRLALQKLREILKDFDKRKCHGRVTEDYDDLTEPTEEVFPKLLWLLKFYQGDLLKKLSQYQKDSAFKYEHKAASFGKELDYETFLRHIIETETKRISLIAQAGSGKTVMLKRLARDLAKHNDELLIFFMNFRDFTDSKEITPCDFLINGRLPDSDAKHSYEWILENQDKVMLILDGLDQATWDIDENAASIGSYGRGKVSDIVSSLFQRKLFPAVKVVYSSREHAVASLEGELRPEMIVALTGLSAVDSEWLFKSFLQEDGKILWEKLRTQSHSLIPLLSIPAFLVFTAIVYVNKPEKPPRSMTEVLKNLLGIFMRSGHIVEKEIPVVMKGLKKMSFCGMTDGKVLFLIIDVRNAGLDPQKICDWIIRIPGLNQHNQFLLEGDYVLIFSHQIIQEFLAAQYIIEEDIKSFKKIVNQYLKKSNWSVVARFVSGLLLNDEISSDLEKDSDIELKKTAFKEMLKKKYQGLKTLSPDVLATISESNCDDFIRDSLQGKKLDVRRLGDSDAYIIGSAMRHLTCLNELRFQSCSLRHETLQIIWDLIENSSLKISKLDLTYIKFESEASTTAGKLIKKCSVDELSLSNCDITNKVFEKLLPGVKISKLNFSNTKLDAETFVIIGDIVQRRSVVKLTMRDCGLADGLLTIERSSSTGMKTSKLNLHRAELKDIEYTTLGKIVKTLAVDELELERCNLTDEKLKNLMIEVDGAKISKLKFSDVKLDADTLVIIVDIVQQCSVEELTMRDCKLAGGSLTIESSSSTGTKDSKLKLYDTKLEDVGYTALGKIVKTGAVDELDLWRCDLTDGKLKNLLIEVNGVKISKLYISGNINMEDKGYATLGKIVKMCAVDQLWLRKCKLSDGKLKNLLSETDGAKISKLDISGNRNVEDKGYATLGKIVKMCAVDQLSLEDCLLSDGKLKNLLSETDGAKILKLDISRNRYMEDKEYATLGKIVKMCEVDQLLLPACMLSDGKLSNLLSETDGTKLSKLDVSYDPLNEATAAVLGDIVKRCSVEELRMWNCKLNNGSLKTLLSRSSEAKPLFIDVRNKNRFFGELNQLSSALLDEISRSMTVEHGRY